MERFFKGTCIVIYISVALLLIGECTRSFSECPAAQEAKKRINLVGWRMIDIPRHCTMGAFVLEDTLSKSEFLAVSYNGHLTMCLIPKCQADSVLAEKPAMSAPFKSNW
jgi:hypothetical protein